MTLEERIRELLRKDKYLSDFLDPEDKDYIAKLIAKELEGEVQSNASY